MSPQAVINSVMDEIEARVVTALNTVLADPITADFVYESLDSFENVQGTVVFVAGEIDTMQPMGACNDQAQLSVGIGFRIPDDGETPKRVQRMAAALAIRAELTWSQTTGTKIPNANLTMVTDLTVSGFGPPRDGWLSGGLNWVGQLQLPRGEA